MKISLDSGSPLPICDAPEGRGGSWSPNGTIVFSPDAYVGVYEVPSSGGKPKEIIKPDTSFQVQSLRYLYFLPDGNHFLYSTKNSYGGSTPSDGIYVASLDNNKPVKLISASSNCQYADGFLFFASQSVLLAQKFNPGKLIIEGEATSVVENVQYFDAGISGTFAVSQDGKLVYIKGNETKQNLVLLDKNGKEIRKISDMIPGNTAIFSPDGNKIASDLGDPNEKKTDVWVYDLKRNVSTKLTFDKSDLVPNWTPDGKQITYWSNVNGKFYDAYMKNADGSGNAELLYKSDFNKGITSISADSKYFLYMGLNYASPTSAWDIFLLPAGKDKKPETILATNFNELGASFSPNMKWIAYQSDESGKYQVYVIPFNSSNPLGTSAKWQISVDGGGGAKWMNNGKSIYFGTPDNKIMGVDVNENGSSLSPGKLYSVFEPGITNVIKIYDIRKDGTEIIAAIAIGESTQSTITLVENWQKGY